MWQKTKLSLSYENLHAMIFRTGNKSLVSMRYQEVEKPIIWLPTASVSNSDFLFIFIFLLKMTGQRVNEICVTAKII